MKVKISTEKDILGIKYSVKDVIEATGLTSNIETDLGMCGLIDLICDDMLDGSCYGFATSYGTMAYAQHWYDVVDDFVLLADCLRSDHRT